MNGTLESVLSTFESEGRALIERHLARVMAGDVTSLHDAVRYHLSRPGKRFRSALAFLVGRQLGVKDDDLAALGAALELAHEASLVHDDIQDGDRVRRGQETVWAKFGVPHAINVGDYLVVRSFAALSHVSDARRVLDFFSDRLARLALGQALDLGDAPANGSSRHAYFTSVRLKTVPLVEIGAVGPALLAGSDASTVEALTAFADALGVTFQVRDDVLDVFGGKRRPLGTDIARGARSFVVMSLVSRLEHAASEVLERAVIGPADEDARLEELRRIAREQGVLDDARAVCAELRAQVIPRLEVLPRDLARMLGSLLEQMIIPS